MKTRNIKPRFSRSTQKKKKKKGKQWGKNLDKTQENRNFQTPKKKKAKKATKKKKKKEEETK
jgi:hypothetical protein